MEQCELNGIASGVIVLGLFALMAFWFWCALEYHKWLRGQGRSQ